jgi:hypothetical protein
MNRQPEIPFDLRETRHSSGSARPTIARWLLMLCAASAVTLLLIAESRLSSEQRQQTFEVSGAYP